MDTNNEIRLLLRFYKDVDDKMENVIQKFKNFTEYDKSHFNIKLCDDHIWFYIIGDKKQYWSPHLHLQLESKENNKTHIRGLFGPDQTLWTFFMFLHFIVAGIFIIFGMIGYSHYSLKQSIISDIVIMFLMVVVWFLLYIIARQIRSNGNGQMNELEELFLKIID
ncbi:MAG TPA: hypothetical protein VN192_03365 [Flavobacterium sp.]|nr:hypothetical protein [Flavobacterium sp.]